IVKNNRTVLGSNIISLSVELGRIVKEKEDFHQLFIGNNFGIIGDLYYFGMSGFAGADCFISWIVNCTAGISRHRFMYAFQHVKTTFNTPETSTAKYNIFKIIFIHI